MEMRPATIIAIVVVIIALIVPVFFLDLDDPEDLELIRKLEAQKV